MDCEACDRQLLDLLDGALDADAERAVRANLAGCERCREALAQLETGMGFARLLPRPEPSPSVRVAVMALARAHVHAAHTTPARTTPARAAPIRAARANVLSGWMDALRAFALTPQFAVVTLLVVAVGVGVWFTRFAAEPGTDALARVEPNGALDAVPPVPGIAEGLESDGEAGRSRNRANPDQASPAYAGGGRADVDEENDVAPPAPPAMESDAARGDAPRAEAQAARRPHRHTGRSARRAGRLQHAEPQRGERALAEGTTLAEGATAAQRFEAEALPPAVEPGGGSLAFGALRSRRARAAAEPRAETAADAVAEAAPLAPRPAGRRATRSGAVSKSPSGADAWGAGGAGPWANAEAASTRGAESPAERAAARRSDRAARGAGLSDREARGAPSGVPSGAPSGVPSGAPSGGEPSGRNRSQAYRAGVSAYRRHDYAEAVRQLGVFIAQASPGGRLPTALHYRADSLRRQGRCASALADYQRLIGRFTAYPARALARIEYAECLDAVGRPGAEAQLIEAMRSPSVAARARRARQRRRTRAQDRRPAPARAAESGPAGQQQ